MIGSWLYHLFGLGNLAGPYYGFWSGAGSDIAELAIVGGLINMARRHNCHVRGCWRVGRHPVEGTSFVVCQRHHPDGAPDHARVLARHGEAKAAYDRIVHRARKPAARWGEAP